MQPRESITINSEQIEGILQFLKETEKLKDGLRSSHTAQGRQESTAEHTWRLCLAVMVLGPWLFLTSISICYSSSVSYTI